MFGVGAGRRLHRRRCDDLHQVVDDDVAQRAHRVVEVSPVLDPEVLRHRDLDALDVVPVPDRLEHRVREPDVEDLLDAHLSEEVVDPVDLRLLQVRVELVGELARGLTVVPERLLDDDSAGLDQPCVRQAFHDATEQEGRDLEVEDRHVRALDRLADALVGRVVAEVALDIGHAAREPVEHRGVDLLAGGGLDRRLCPVAELIHGPVVDRDADDRAVEQPAGFEPVEGMERHHLREVAGDPEDHKDVGDSCRGIRAGGRGARHRCHLKPPFEGAAGQR